ncbi:DUF6089 family protein [Bizionia paragorgiae]|uniref:type IX secretion system protein PorG n=1 Tax=Bizionia paragorgiae TaxID=283786 RepID=UPI00299CDFF7|nr:DUF6089 family protein [Bizionia paragorgiae]MDX1271399.1 DUF6089 family protein [Bizionia paragorgiae]
MKYISFLLITLFSIQLSSAQIHEFGVFLGGSNFIGDVGATNYIAPSQLAIGGIYKWNRSPRHSWRVSLLFSELEGIDSKSDDAGRIERGYEFTNNIIELSAGMEFTFWEFDLHSDKRAATPYLYSGISVAKHDNFYFNNAKVVSENTSSYAYGIPLVLGFKASISSQFVLAFEVGARYTFSDELDGSIPDSENLVESKRFGNINNNDWYTFTGVTLTYTFGRNPCFCPY